MERQPRFDLTAATEAWLDALRQRGTLTDDDLRELQSHLLDAVEPLKASRLSEEEAFLVARHRLGSAEVVSEEFGKIQRPFVVRREPVLFLLGAMAFLVLKNGLDALGFGATRWLLTHIAEDGHAILADFGTRVLLFGAFVAGLTVYIRRGEALHRRAFAWLHRAPVATVLTLSVVVGIVQLAVFTGYNSLGRFGREFPTRDLHGLRLNERLFAYGVYIAWLAALLWLAFRQGPLGRRSFAGWLKHAHALPLMVLGFGLFLACFLGVGVEMLGRFWFASNEWLGAGSSLVYCLGAGFALAGNPRYSFVSRLLIAMGPILLWCLCGFILRETPSETWNYFLLRTGTASLLGALLGLGLGTIRQQKKATA